MSKLPDNFDKAIANLKARTIIDEKTGCWLNQGALDKDGYGERIQIKYQRISPHRLSAHIYLGLDLNNTDFQALHKRECTNKNCWNSDHLYVGTKSDNMRDQVVLGTHKETSKTKCNNGHEFNEWNTYITPSGKRQCRICKNLRRNPFYEVPSE